MRAERSASGPGETRIVIVDDHPLLRSGVRATLEQKVGFRVVGEAGSAREAFQICRTLSPHVVVTDITMKGLDGLELIAELHRWHQHPRIVVLSMHSDMAARAFELGACGYVVKDDAATEIVACIEAVMSEERYASHSVQSAADDLGDRIKSEAELTETELRVIRLIATHMTSREVAEVMCVSRRTVQNHRANMCRKLGLRGPQALLRYALARDSRDETDGAGEGS